MRFSTLPAAVIRQLYGLFLLCHPAACNPGVWWLLPFLVARALMPVGFMAQVHDGRVQIEFCGASGQLQAADHDRLISKHAAAQADFSCPFAHVAAAPLLSLNSSHAVELIATAEILPQQTLPNLAAGPPRLERVRGPPGFT